MWRVWWTTEVHTGFWWRNLKETAYFEYVNINEGIILKRIFK